MKQKVYLSKNILSNDLVLLVTVNSIGSSELSSRSVHQQDFIFLYEGGCMKA